MAAVLTSANIVFVVGGPGYSSALFTLTSPTAAEFPKVIAAGNTLTLEVALGSGLPADASASAAAVLDLHHNVADSPHAVTLVLDLVGGGAVAGAGASADGSEAFVNGAAVGAGGLAAVAICVACLGWRFCCKRGGAKPLPAMTSASAAAAAASLGAAAAAVKAGAKGTDSKTRGGRYDFSDSENEEGGRKEASRRPGGGLDLSGSDSGSSSGGESDDAKLAHKSRHSRRSSHRSKIIICV
jgi:hypothetical protein